MKETIYNKETSNCLVLISHKMDENSFKYFSFLQKEADGIMDLIILYDCATCEIKERDYPEFAFHFFDSKEIIDFFHGGNKQLPNPLLALLDLIKVKKYDHYLLMEKIILSLQLWRFFLFYNQKESKDISYMERLIRSMMNF